MVSRHRRFFVALGVGLAIGIAALLLPMAGEATGGPTLGSGMVRRSLTDVQGLLLAVNGFFLTYLALMLRFAARVTPDDLRDHARQSDEGLPLILLLAFGAVAVSLTAIAGLLMRPGGGGTVEVALALASVPLGWAMVQVLAGFHYACLFYTPEGEGDAAGLSFPKTPEPGAWEFLYFSFGIGMTAQVSDVVVESTRLRRVVGVHAVGSFFYNTVILALAVNVAVGLG